MIIWKVHGVNIVQVITETINNLFYNLFSSIDNSLYSTLDDLLFINLLALMKSRCIQNEISSANRSIKIKAANVKV